MTRQRRVILQKLQQVKTHPSAEEVYEIVRQELPRISLGTVYRNLETLVQSGEIQRLEHCGTTRRFDGNTNNHYHIRCVRCGRVDDVEIDPVQELDDQVRHTTDYQVIGHQLEFLGFCRDCSEKWPQEPS